MYCLDAGIPGLCHEISPDLPENLHKLHFVNLLSRGNLEHVDDSLTVEKKVRLELPHIVTLPDFGCC